MRKQKVLLLSEGFGCGHTRAAHALALSLSRYTSNIESHVIELGSYLNPTIAPWILAAYRKTVSARPRFMGMVYRYQYRKSISRFSSLALHRLFYTETWHLLKQYAPDLIVCTHPIPNVIISRLKRLGLCHAPLVTLLTDYDAHATWITPEVNTYLISTAEVKYKMLMHDVPLSKMVVSGIPVHPDFWQNGCAEDIRRRFGLQEMPTVLLMGGGWGILDQIELLLYLMKYRNHVQFILCLGNNDKARKQLASDPVFQHKHVHVLGFTNEIHQLMEVSDLLITKPGGITCTEALAKGLPMLFLAPLPGQEEENCHYFTKHGYGELIHSHDTIDTALAQLIQENPDTHTARREYRKRVHATPPIAYVEVIADLLEREQQQETTDRVYSTAR